MGCMLLVLSFWSSKEMCEISDVLEMKSRTEDPVPSMNRHFVSAKSPQRCLHFLHETDDKDTPRQGEFQTGFRPCLPTKLLLNLSMELAHLRFESTQSM